MSMYGKKEEFKTNIHGLIVKGEELGGEGSRKEGGGGGSVLSRRKSSDFIHKLSLFENIQEAEDPRSVQTSSFTFSNLTHSNSVSENKSNTLQSHRIRGGTLLAERRTNEKRGQADGEDSTCVTKKQRLN